MSRALLIVGEGGKLFAGFLDMQRLLVGSQRPLSLTVERSGRQLVISIERSILRAAAGPGGQLQVATR
ncbi:MAG: hypothetical protein JXQ29_06005 [Planctomycetes bacterium]|nr:hypothetical protein [Planctomycetota bacterium]